MHDAYGQCSKCSADLPLSIISPLLFCRGWLTAHPHRLHEYVWASVATVRCWVHALERWYKSKKRRRAVVTVRVMHSCCMYMQAKNSGRVGHCSSLCVLLSLLPLSVCCSTVPKVLVIAAVLFTAENTYSQHLLGVARHLFASVRVPPNHPPPLPQGAQRLLCCAGLLERRDIVGCAAAWLPSYIGRRGLLA